MWFQEAFFKYATAIILVLLIIFLLYETAPVFYPVSWFIAAILLPILFATFLYYILRPIVDILVFWKIPRYASILLVYTIIGLVGMGVFFVAGSKIWQEASSIANITPEKLETLKSNTTSIINDIKQHINTQLVGVDSILFDYFQKLNTFLSHLLINTVTTLASIAIALILTPFVLYYFLKDDDLFSRFILRFVPKEFHEEVQKILSDIDMTLSKFILAQVTVAIVVGFFLFLGYFFIGLPQALSLALFAMIFYVIPILGTFIAIIPALLVGLTISPFMAFKVILVMLFAHFLEANLLTPRLMSKQLKIHPLTIILLLLAAGSLYGLLGLLLVTPTYAIMKVIVWNLYKISRLRYEESKIRKAAAAEEAEIP